MQQVSIVILTIKGSKDTAQCLNSLANVKTAAWLDWQVIDNTGQGVAVGINKGIMKAVADKADYVMLLNNDTVVDVQFIDNMLAVSADIVTPKVYHWGSSCLQPYLNTLNMWTGELVHVPGLGKMVVDTGQYDRVKTTGWVSGCCVLIKREVFEKVGLFDEQYGMYWEDIDFVYRAVKAGFNIGLAPDAKIWHKGGQATTALGKVRAYTRNKIVFMRKHATKLQFAVFVLYYFGFRLWAMLLYYTAITGDWQYEKAILGGTYEGFVR